MSKLTFHQNLDEYFIPPYLILLTRELFVLVDDCDRFTATHY